MPPTIKQIAELAGVSRGTVDRVLNNRGNVNPKTADKICKIAKALNYTPSRPGKTLALKKKQFKFGFILLGTAAGNPFYEEVLAGAREKAAELNEYGAAVEIRHTALDDAASQAALIDELTALGIHGLAIMPIRHPLITQKIADLSRQHIPVVTVNSDLPDCGRLAYVGSNSFKSGETAAGLMARFCRGQAKVGIVLGSELVAGHADRAAGFISRLSEAYPQMRLIDKVYNQDDDIISFNETLGMLNRHPEIDALFLASAGVRGACRALDELKPVRQITVISFDLIPYTLRMVKQGIIAATLGQQPEIQGRKPLELLFDTLGFDILPDREYYYTAIDIRIAENLPDF